jgi:hypothetical protein
MTYEQLVQFIREEGCRVYVYKNKDTIHGGCRGTFDHNEKHGPIICVATSNIEPKKKLETLLHEYGHYLQYRDGFMQYVDGITSDCNEVTLKWLAGKIELTDREKLMVRNAMLIMEYDAEKRGYQTGCWLEPEHWDEDFYMQGAAAYMDSIKWEFLYREFSEVATRKIYEPKILTLKELLAPMSEEKIEKIRRDISRPPGGPGLAQ